MVIRRADSAKVIDTQPDFYAKTCMYENQVRPPRVYMLEKKRQD